MRKAMSFAALAALLALLAFSTGGSKDIRYFYHFTEIETLKSAEGTLLEIPSCPDCANVAPWREPMLPTKGLTLLLPYGYDLDRIEVIAGKPQELEISGKIQYSPRQYPLSYTGPALEDGPKASIYSSANPYPGVRYANVKIQNKMGYKILILNLFPVDYLPAVNKVRLYKDMTLVVHLKKSSKSSRQIAIRNLASDRAAILNIVNNPDVLQTYPKYAASSLKGKLPKANYRYVIVAPNQFIGLSGSNTLEQFRDFKIAQGLTATIQSIETIQTTYPGRDNAEKLRNFVKDAYNNWNTEFVLLVGDADRSAAGGESGAILVPRRDLWSSTDYGYSDNLPADMYFVCLDGDFNYDGDSTWGEPNDGPGGGEVDLLYELYVGRVAADSDTEVRNFVSKTFAYFNYSPGESFMKTAIMLGELLWSDPTYGDDYKEEIRLGSSNWGYTTVGFPLDKFTVNTLYDRPGTWTASQLINIINSNANVIMNHLGHCNVNYCLRLYNDDVDNDFTNSKYFFAYSQGCLPGAFDNTNDSGSVLTVDSIAEHFTLKDKGMFAFVGNARYGWGQHSSTNGSSQYYDRQFFDAIFGENIYELGHINADSKEDNIGFLDYGANRWCYFEINVFGDPHATIGRTVFKNALLSIDKDVYADEDQMLVSIADSDLDANSSQPDQIVITITTTSGDSENLTLTETGNASATFVGTIIVNEGAAQQNNGKVDAQHGATITISYYDADTGSGAQWKYVYADADFLAPDFDGLASAAAGESQVTLTWNAASDDHAPVTYYIFRADESGDYDFDEPLASTQDTTYVDTNLHNYYTYFYLVRAEDRAGNRDANTVEKSARPTGPIPFFIEDFEYDKSFDDWTINDLNSDGVSWTDLNPGQLESSYVESIFASVDAGHYLATPFEEELVSPEIDASFFTSLVLKFGHEFDKDSLAEKTYVYVSKDGTNWEELEKFNDDSAGIAEYALSATYDQASTLYIKFYYFNKPHLFGNGFWVLDNVMFFGRPIEDPAPMADFTASPTSGDAPLDVTFTGTYSGLIDNYYWDFGDGNTSTEMNPTHTYAEPGTYTVSLTVNGEYGSHTETKDDYIEVFGADDDTDDDDAGGDDDSGGSGGCGC